MNVVMIPSAGGGIGHIARTATLGRMLQKLAPETTVEYLLDSERLRPFNIEMAARTGFRVQFLPPRPRDARDAIVRACLGHADVIVDDTTRYLVPLRRIVPQAAWVSIPLPPIGDELFMDWPFLAQTDAVIWAYPPALGTLPELALIADKLLRTGPFLELADVPARAAARARLGLGADEEIVLYAPRGMPFGPEFGRRVLGGLYGAVEALRATRPRLRLVLVAVGDPAELRGSGLPDALPAWVTVRGVVAPEESLAYLRAADIAIAEGTSTAHEAAALGTALVMVPGPIYETWLLGTRLHEHEAAHILWIERVTPEALAGVFADILAEPTARAARQRRARDFVTGGGGVAAAARLVLDLAARRRGLSADAVAAG